MQTKVIKIAADFSATPLGRYYEDGPFPGQKFREDLLIPALRSNDCVLVDLDGVEGLGSSFLEEAFGGLVRKGFSEQEIKSRLKIKATGPKGLMYLDLIWQHIRVENAKHHTLPA
jgi:hypothetical protein